MTIGMVCVGWQGAVHSGCLGTARVDASLSASVASHGKLLPEQDSSVVHLEHGGW